MKYNMKYKKFLIKVLNDTQKINECIENGGNLKALLKKLKTKTYNPLNM